MNGSEDPPGLTFGIYPGGMMEDADGTPIGTADEPARVQAALARLHAPGQPLVVRGYRHYAGAGRTGPAVPAEVTSYLGPGRRLDLVLCYRTPDGDLDDWTGFVRATVRRDGAQLSMLQVAEEPNSTAAAGDGPFPRVREAVVAGVIAAKDEARRQGLAVQVGFYATPDFSPAADFWPALAALSGPDFREALDYVGLDFFPDVFRPVAPDGSAQDLRETVGLILRHFRAVSLAAGRIPASVPIHVTEHGWPTGPTRSYARQARVLETVVRTVHAHREELNITGYEHFDLRDADSARPDLFSQFGLLRDDYTPKPAFETYRRLIAELGRR